MLDEIRENVNNIITYKYLDKLNSRYIAPELGKLLFEYLVTHGEYLSFHKCILLSVTPLSTTVLSVINCIYEIDGEIKNTTLSSFIDTLFTIEKSRSWIINEIKNKE